MYKQVYHSLLIINKKNVKILMEINKIYNCDCIEGLKQLEDNSIDLTVTSPPYDDLRSYGDTLEWNFDVFKQIAKELYRVTKPGGVVVWVVGDATIKGGETGTSFKQALYFKDECGFILHDTMIYEKNGSSRPAKRTSKRYSQIFEYMFVFTKGEIRKDITLIADKRNKWAGWAKWGKNSSFNVKGDLIEVKKQQPVISEFSLRNNIWKYSVSFNDKTGHPAVFPEKLAEDNILSWSVEGDLVLDPFMGSGTTAKMAMLNKRNFIGFEKNTEYYEKSLERISKYEGKINESLSAVTTTNEYGEEETLQYSTSEDKELEGKTELFNQYLEQLNQYFNEQTLGTLKTLKFNFVTKTNEERVKKIIGIDETNPVEVRKEIERLETILNSFEPENFQPSAQHEDNITKTDDKEICLSKEEPKEPITSNIKFDFRTQEFKDFLFEFLLKFYQLKRLPDSVIEVNERAREEQLKKDAETSENKFGSGFFDKPKKRKRRTKAEILEKTKQHEIESPIIADSVNSSEHNDDVIVESINYNENTNVVEANAKFPGSLEHVDVTINPSDLIDTKPVDDLPFEFTEEERKRLLGIELADIVDGKPVYKDYTEVTKRHRGRPKKEKTVLTVPVALKANEPDSNGMVYSEEALKEAVDKFNNDLHEQQVEVKVKRPRGRPRKIKLF